MAKSWFLSLLLSVPLLGAEVVPPSPVPQHKLVRVKLADGERAWVISSTFDPVDTEWVGKNLVVWTGPPGKYAVLVWSDTSQSQLFVTIGGTVPPPVPPDPDPPNPPDPDPPNPPGPDPPTPSLPNDFGIGAVCYKEAAKVGKPQEAASIAVVARRALQNLIEGRVTPAGAEAMLRKAHDGLSDWSSWELAVEDALSKAIVKHGSGGLRYRDYFLEIAAGLEAAGKLKGTN